MFTDRKLLPRAHLASFRETQIYDSRTQSRDRTYPAEDFEENDDLLTCTVLSRTTCDTVSRSCAAMPGFPRPRVNFLSLILVNADRHQSIPDQISHVRLHRSPMPANNRRHHAQSRTCDHNDNRLKDRDQLPSLVCSCRP